MSPAASAAQPLERRSSPTGGRGAIEHGAARGFPREGSVVLVLGSRQTGSRAAPVFVADLGATLGPGRSFEGRGEVGGQRAAVLVEAE
jgi:hypothetical protein